MVVVACVSAPRSHSGTQADRDSAIFKTLLPRTPGCVNIQRAKAGLRMEGGKRLSCGGFSGPSLTALPSTFHSLISAPWAHLTTGVAEEQGLATCQGRERADFDYYVVVSALSRDMDSVYLVSLNSLLSTSCL